MFEGRQKLKLKFDGEYSCKMHDINWVFKNEKELQVHLHTYHFKDAAEKLQQYGIPKELVVDHFGRNAGKTICKRVRKIE